MPVYEYQCTQCGKMFELLRSITADDSDLKCPECGDEHPQRAISTFARSGHSESACASTGSG